MKVKKTALESVLLKARGGMQMINEEELDRKDLPAGTPKRPLDGGSGVASLGDAKDNGGDKGSNTTANKRPLDEEDAAPADDKKKEDEKPEVKAEGKELPAFIKKKMKKEESDPASEPKKDDEKADAKEPVKEAKKSCKEEDCKDPECKDCKKDSEVVKEEDAPKIEIKADEVEAEKAKAEKELKKEEVDPAAKDSEKKDDKAVSEEEDKEEDKPKAPEDMKEHLSRLFSGNSLNEEVQSKITKIFESAVSQRTEFEKKIVINLANKKINEAVSSYKSTLVENVDSYLGYVVDEWMKENKVAVEQSLRVELAEAFIGDLRNLFIKHNISIPENQFDLVEELQKTVTDLEGQLSEEMKSNMGLKKQVKALQRESEVLKLSEGMTRAEREKFATLAESVTHSDVLDLGQKLKVLKESHFGKQTVKRGNSDPALIVENEVGESVGIETEEANKDSVSPQMKQYLSAARVIRS